MIQAPGASTWIVFIRATCTESRLEQRQIKAALRRRIGRDFRPLAPDALMKKAMPPAPQRRRPALRPIDLYVLTSWNIFERHIFLTSSTSVCRKGIWRGP